MIKSTSPREKGYAILQIKEPVRNFLKREMTYNTEEGKTYSAFLTTLLNKHKEEREAKEKENQQ